jgi:hypothetical protein
MARVGAAHAPAQSKEIPRALCTRGGLELSAFAVRYRTTNGNPDEPFILRQTTAI